LKVEVVDERKPANGFVGRAFGAGVHCVRHGFKVAIRRLKKCLITGLKQLLAENAGYPTWNIYVEQLQDQEPLEKG
jgi:hypothetical protein